MVAASPPKSVLIIEDTSSIRGIQRAILKDMGVATVHEAINGREALKLLDKYQYQLLVCDWDMPEMDGLELLKAIRQSPTQQNLPFLMVTGVIQAAKVKEAITAGVNDYLVKPFKQDQFSEKAGKLLAL
jgi:two-component system chemotaxis response regulator CheY